MKLLHAYILSIFLVTACNSQQKELEHAVNERDASIVTLQAHVQTIQHDLATATEVFNTCQKTQKTEDSISQDSGEKSFLGYWVNEDSKTRGITKVTIERRLKNLLIHMWGACHPNDCDWGKNEVDVSNLDNGTLFIVWRFDYVTNYQELRILPDDRLRVMGYSHFTDQSGRSDRFSSYVFVRE